MTTSRTCLPRRRRECPRSPDSLPCRPRLPPTARHCEPRPPMSASSQSHPDDDGDIRPQCDGDAARRSRRGSSCSGSKPRPATPGRPAEPRRRPRPRERKRPPEHISIKASSTPLSRHRYRSTTAVSKVSVATSASSASPPPPRREATAHSRRRACPDDPHRLHNAPRRADDPRPRPTSHRALLRRCREPSPRDDPECGRHRSE